MRPIGERHALKLPRFIERQLPTTRVAADGTEAEPGAAERAENPFLRARDEFTNAFGDLAKGKRNWQLMAFAATGLLLFESVAYVHLAESRRLVPYVVQVDRLAQIVGAGAVDELKRPDDRLVASQLAGFLRAIRTVLPAAAAVAQAEVLRRGYRFLGPDAAAFLNDYFSLPEHDPRVLGTRLTRQVDVASVIRVPNSDVWRLEWTETERGSDPGGPVRTAAWEGYATVKLIPLRSPEVIEDNPLGLQVTSVSWTQVAESAPAPSTAPTHSAAEPGP